MKASNLLFIAAILIAGCQAPPPPVDNSAQEAFDANCKTVMNYLEEFQKESVDYSVFADDFVQAGTRHGAPDSTSLSEMQANHAKNFGVMDFKLLADPINFLPGVNADTKEMDGSVRYYGAWEVTLSATDSTEAKSSVIRNYASYDFNSDGKIIFSQFYGDIGGVMQDLYSAPEESEEEMAEE